MSTLQCWLIGIGLSLLVAIAGHAIWQSRRFRVKPVAGPAASKKGGGAAPVRPLEPAFKTGESFPAAAARQAVSAPLAPLGAAGGSSRPLNLEAAQIDQAPQDDDPTGFTLNEERSRYGGGSRRPVVRIDALIDAIVSMRLENPVSAEEALAQFPAARRAGSKSFLIEGLDVDSGDWEPIVAEHRYSEFQAGIQLANRLGPLNEIEYSEFVQKVQAFSEGVNALLDFPDMVDVVQRAAELDNFACARDAQLAMRLRARSASWSVALVQNQVIQQGFVPGSVPGQLVLEAEEDNSPPILTLQFDAQAAFAEDPYRATVTELVLTFDVPQTAAEVRPYDHWCRVGLGLAVDLDAVLFDDSGQPLNPDSLPAVGEELNKLYVALAERDLAAGSAAARRLFS